MKAIVRETYGPPDVLHLEEVPLPTLHDSDVSVNDDFATHGQRYDLILPPVSPVKETTDKMIPQPFAMTGLRCTIR